MRTMLTMVNGLQIIISDIAHTVYIRLTVFLNFSKLLFVLNDLAFTKYLLRWCTPCLLLWTLFRSSFLTLPTLCISHLQCFELFEIAVSFAHFGFTHFGFYEISTPVMRTMQTMVNVFQIIISDLARPFYITFTVFWDFSKLLFVLHILAFTKFLLRWCAPW